jgi:hypothetical protein
MLITNGYSKSRRSFRNAPCSRSRRFTEIDMVIIFCHSIVKGLPLGSSLARLVSMTSVSTSWPSLARSNCPVCVQPMYTFAPSSKARKAVRGPFGLLTLQFLRYRGESIGDHSSRYDGNTQAYDFDCRWQLRGGIDIEIPASKIYPV